ncbi:cupin domain-containing protein [Peredibacter starrii]|uniref:Cupin domain-containing protein n=1 Tax=Peredibacter starrii TaxID=28202 RepID=A0AAX4HTX3_9BACT|nr:cupin domain-containing protein [Peredibacter starrii]WPU66667.1 cupin domain-containing protein [Peredibacter starrii]
MKLVLVTLLSIWTVSAFSVDHVMKMPSDIQWGEAPPFLMPGAKLAVMSGDPHKKGLYTLRLQLPANYRIMPHWHPTDEHVTVVQGTLNMGTTDIINEKTSHALPTGSYALMPAKFHHYAYAGPEGAIVQVHGMGPFEITYINPSDDPRKKK